MKRLAFVFGFVSLVASVLVFVLADGARRVYSGGFFLILAIVFFSSWRRWRAENEAAPPSDADAPRTSSQ